MYDARALTMAQLRQMAGVTSADGMMTTGQVRKATGLSCAQVYSCARRLRWRGEIEPTRLYQMADVLKAINSGVLTLRATQGTWPPRPRTPNKARLISLRLSAEEAAALAVQAAHYRLTQSAVIRRLILAGASALAQKKA